MHTLKKLALLLTLSAVAAPHPALSQNERQNPEQYYRAPGSIQGKTLVLPMGTTFEGRMDESIGSSMSRQGQTFTISMASPVLANGVDVLIPAGSQVMGEVVEAIPASHVARRKGYPKPVGKLRVQLTGLRTPDGVSYPLVGSLAGEDVSTGQGVRKPNQNIGAGIGYTGSQASFEAVSPQMQSQSRAMRGRPPEVVTKQKLLSDPIYGLDASQRNNSYEKQAIRALVHRGRELYIASGSAVTVRLDAPFKIGMAPPQAQIDTLSAPSESSITGGRRFAPTGSAQQQGDNQNSQSASSNPLPGILPDTPHGQTTTQPLPNQPQGQTSSGPGSF